MHRVDLNGSWQMKKLRAIGGSCSGAGLSGY